MKQKLHFLSLLLLAMLGGASAAWATDVMYSPVLDVNFRTAAGNTGWQTVKNAADEGNTDFELTSTAGFFALQKYTIPQLQYATKLVITLTVGSKSGVDAVRLWSLPLTDWTAASGTDDIYPKVKEVLGVDLRATEGTANDPLVKAAKVADSSPAKATFTISGDALSTIKSNAAANGTFTLLFTNDNLTNDQNKRSYLSSNTANAEANRPQLVATLDIPSVVNKTTGTSYSSLEAAIDALTDADTELEVSEDQTITKRMTWSKAHTLTITPTKDITIKASGTNYMWFLVNKASATLNLGSDNYTITLDGQDKTYGIDVTKYEENSTIALTNVTFQNFDLNSAGHLVGSKANEGQIILDCITFQNCKNPANGFIDKERVTNDRVVLKGYLNQEDCTGTTIYAATEKKSGSATTGRIKIDDNNFTASSVITINWTHTDDADGDVVVIGSNGDNKTKFRLVNEGKGLYRKSNKDLVLYTASYNLSVTEAKAATLVLPFEATIPSGVTCYTLNYTAGSSSVKATAVEGTLPAKTPVLVNAEQGNYTFACTSADIETHDLSQKPAVGALTGVYQETAVPSGSFVLNMVEGAVGFYLADGSIMAGAYRAYLTAESSDSRLTISFDELTGIEEMESRTQLVESCFDLSGRRVEAPRKGIYVKNGKKIIIK